jgi:alpha-galactosidase
VDDRAEVTGDPRVELAKIVRRYGWTSVLIHLVNSHTSVIVDLGDGAPALRHWGARLADDVDLATFDAMTARPVAHGSLDVDPTISLVPEHGSGFAGRPGLAGHRPGGQGWSPRFRHESHTVNDGVLEAIAVDAVAELQLASRVSLGDVLSVRVTLTNTSASEPYHLAQLGITLPLPPQARELLQFTGRWTRELHPYRTPFDRGAYTAENRRGRTSHEHAPLIFAGTRSFGEWDGEVWGAHLAWSGNHQLLAEVLADGRRYLQIGELLHSGEVMLAAGESYHSPELIATYSPAGLTRASWGFHRSVRSRSPIRTPRPVLLNTWEAVYFDHDTDRLAQLADAAAAVGVERFVLDDGWFGSRRNDRRGLGDWWVSPDVYPHGLTPLIDHVRRLGMEFGIWVEPEMVNPDSDVYRAHPEWALVTEGYEPVLGRHQLVLNLAHPDAYAHIFAALDSLLRDHDIGYLKWDMNRDHVQGSGANGAAGTHAQTLAVYRLLDELRARHPQVEIESCSSGGARIDHEILRRTERVWTSDCNDALERQTIQRGASLFIPPEVMGAHIGPRRSHTTGRVHSLAFRSATAMFGHLGLEWNLLEISDQERAHVTAVIALHKLYRDLLHGGDAVRFDALDESTLAHGVYATDRSEGLVCVSRLATGDALVPHPLTLPDLDAGIRYRVEAVPLPDDAERAPSRSEPSWMNGGLVATGRELGTIGVQLPVMNPESALLLRLEAELAR